MVKRFQRTQEDFICCVCGTFVKGNGYTDHCPKCLTSKHVDISPGDRANPCQGILKPIGVEQKKGKMYILYQCQTCHKIHRNQVADNDDFDAILALMRNQMP